MTRRGLLRVLDANANRALEGLRVCEDLARFHLEAPALFRRTRALRHAAARALRSLPIGPSDLARARDSRRDPGRRAHGSRIASLERLLVINLQRTKEALRVLEECSRLVAPRQSRVFQHLRFRTYEVERDLLLRVEAVRHP